NRTALVRHAALHALGHELVDVHVRVLEIAVRGALLHSAERAHAAVGLVGAPLIELDFAGRLVGAGEEGAEHYGVRAGGDGFRDVARVAHAAVGDERHAALLQRPRDVLAGAELRP